MLYIIKNQKNPNYKFEKFGDKNYNSAYILI